MDNRQRLRSHIKRDGNGIEIGPSHNPIAPKRDGYNVDVIDHMSREELVSKYAAHGVDLDAIEEVDFVWDGTSYSELTGHKRHYDWVIASHMIEHTPDMIGFINDCDAILKDDGVLALLVPDKRFCFDYFRPLSGISKLIDAHIAGRVIHSPGEVAEYFLNVVKKNDCIAWDASNSGSFDCVHSLSEAKSGMKAVIDSNAYLDIHAWVFIASSFRLIIKDLYDLGFITLKEVGFYPTVGHEFVIILSRDGNNVDVDRVSLLEDIATEANANLTMDTTPAVEPEA